MRKLVIVGLVMLVLVVSGCDSVSEHNLAVNECQHFLSLSKTKTDTLMFLNMIPPSTKEGHTCEELLNSAPPIFQRVG